MRYRVMYMRLMLAQGNKPALVEDVIEAADIYVGDGTLAFNNAEGRTFMALPKGHWFIAEPEEALVGETTSSIITP